MYIAGQKKNGKKQNSLWHGIDTKIMKYLETII